MCFLPDTPNLFLPPFLGGDVALLQDNQGAWKSSPSLPLASHISQTGTAIHEDKLWYDGKYHELKEIDALKDEGYLHVEAVDMSKNGTILCKALQDLVTGTYKVGILVPIDIVAYKRGTINAPGVQQPKGNGEYGYETVMMENADSEDNNTGKRDCDTAAVDKAKDDDFVKIVLHYPGPKIEGASLELKHEGIAVDAKVKGSEMENPEDAIEVLDTGSRLTFYDKDGNKLNPATDLKITDLKNPGSGYLAKILDPANNGKLTLFIEGADDFGTVGPSLGPVKWNHTAGTVSKVKTATKKLGGARLKWAFEKGAQKTEVPVLVYRGGFLAFKQPSGSPGATGTLEFWDGKGRIRHEYGGHEKEFKTDDTDWGTRLKSWSAKSGKPKPKGKDYNIQGGLGHIPPGWWINYERTILTGGQKNKTRGSGNSKRITQGSYCRWEQDDADANGRYTKNYEYKASNQKDKTIGEPKSISFKFELLPLPPTSGQKRKYIQIHPDGKKDGTAGCIGIQTYSGAAEVVKTLRAYNNLVIKVETE